MSSSYVFSAASTVIASRAAGTVASSAHTTGHRHGATQAVSAIARTSFQRQCTACPCATSSASRDTEITADCRAVTGRSRTCSDRHDSTGTLGRCTSRHGHCTTSRCARSVSTRTCSDCHGATDTLGRCATCDGHCTTGR